MTKRVHTSNFKIYCISQDTYIGVGYTNKITWSKKKAVIDAAKSIVGWRSEKQHGSQYRNVKGIEDLEIHEFVLAPAIATPLKDLV